MTKEETWSERVRADYWRLRKELNELHQRQIREYTQRINDEIKRSIQKELDAMQDAIRKGDIVEAYRHQMILEVLFR